MRPIERTYSSVIRPVEGAASEAVDDALGGAAIDTARVPNKAAAAAYRNRVAGSMTLLLVSSLSCGQPQQRDLGRNCEAVRGPPITRARTDEDPHALVP